MRSFVILAMLFVSSSAMFMNSRSPSGPPGPGRNSGPPGNGGGGGNMPDMGFVMHMVRQIVMSLLPKLIANPSLMSAMVGGKGPGQPPMPPMGSPFSPPPRGPPAMPPVPPPMAGGMNSMNIFGPPAPQPAGRVAPGYMPITSSDTMKDMRLFELLRDPTVGLQREIAHLIPRGPMPWGWSLPDYMKDQILYAIQRRVMSRGTYSAKEREIVTLIGDPVEKMPHIFGPGSRIRPM